MTDKQNEDPDKKSAVGTSDGKPASEGRPTEPVKDAEAVSKSESSGESEAASAGGDKESQAEVKTGAGAGSGSSSAPPPEKRRAPERPPGKGGKRTVKHPLGDRDTVPWYKEPWPWILIALPGAVVIASFVTMYIALTHKDTLVTDDYYKDGKDIHLQMERDQRAALLNVRASVFVQNDGEGVLVVTSGNYDPAVPLKLVFFHPTIAERDRTVHLEQVEGNPNQYTGSFDKPLPDSVTWKVRLEDADHVWRLDKRWVTAEGNGVNMEPNKVILGNKQLLERTKLTMTDEQLGLIRQAEEEEAALADSDADEDEVSDDADAGAGSGSEEDSGRDADVAATSSEKAEEAAPNEAVSEDTGAAGAEASDGKSEEGEGVAEELESKALEIKKNVEEAAEAANEASMERGKRILEELGEEIGRDSENANP